MRDIIQGTLKAELAGSRLNEIAQIVVDALMRKMDTTLRAELETTKNPCYSIGTEIKHCLRNSPISYDSEQKIMARIERLLQGKKLAIEQKEQEEDR